VSFYVSTTTFFLRHCDEWDRVVALPRHKFVTGATLLQLDFTISVNLKSGLIFCTIVTKLNVRVGNSLLTCGYENLFGQY
jgi:hypothetical protein